MKPLFGQSPRNRMRRFDRLDHILMLFPVASTSAGRRIANHRSISITQIGSVFFITSSPTPNADDLVVFLPFWKRIVCGMKDHHATAAFDVFDEVLLGLFRPIRTVVIENNDVVFREGRLKL